MSDDTSIEDTEADSKALRNLIGNVLSGSVPGEKDLIRMRNFVHSKAKALQKKVTVTRMTKTAALQKNTAKKKLDRFSGARADTPLTAKKACWFCSGSGTMDEYAKSLQAPLAERGDDDDPECLVCWGPAQVSCLHIHFTYC